ncbi:MAG: hypothetical protein [Bacteroides phage LoVEphage]|nr:MAG: hypothetical protein [Bacteroides phage LoVEphage]
MPIFRPFYATNIVYFIHNYHINTIIFYLKYRINTCF